MTDWTGQDYLNELSRREGARLPATLGEVWNAEWSRAGLDTIGGVGQPFRDAMGELEAAIAGASGQDVTDYAFSHGINLAGAASQDERVAMLGRLADTLPEDKRKPIEPLKDVRKRAADKAQKIEADAADTAGATYGLSGVATSWLAAIARQTVDPVNLAAMAITAPIGGPEGAPLWKFLARQAGAGAAAQAAVEPTIEPARAQLGLEAGPGRALTNIAEAGIGGGALAGLFRGAGAAIRLARGHAPEVAPAEPPLQTESNIFPGYMMPEDAAAFDRGHPTSATERGFGVGAGDVPGFASGPLDIAEAARAQPTRVRLPEPPSPPPSDFTPGYLQSEDAAAFDRGRPLTQAEQGVGIGTGAAALDNAGGWHGFDMVSAADLDAAARAAEGEHLIDATAAAPTVEARQAHAAAVEDAARAMEQGKPLADAAESPQPPLRAPQRPQYGRPLSLFEYLANGRGLAPSAELQHLLDGNPTVPGIGKLIRPGGLSLDQAIAAAKEGRYLFDAADVAGGEAQVGQQHLLDLIAEEARGNRQYPASAEGTMTGPERAAAAERNRVEIARAREQAAAEFDTRMTELQITEVPKVLKSRALQIMEKEGEKDPLLAYERALVEKETLQEAQRRVRQANPAIDIPGWDVPEISHDAGSAPSHGEAAARAAPERPGDTGYGAGARADRNGTGTAGESGQLGDPALKVDAERALAERGGDFDIILENPDGTTRRVSARQALREAEDDAGAAAELKDCAGGGGKLTGPEGA